MHKMIKIQPAAKTHFSERMSRFIKVKQNFTNSKVQYTDHDRRIHVNSNGLDPKFHALKHVRTQCVIHAAQTVHNLMKLAKFLNFVHFNTRQPT